MVQTAHMQTQCQTPIPIKEVSHKAVNKNGELTRHIIITPSHLQNRSYAMKLSEVHRHRWLLDSITPNQQSVWNEQEGEKDRKA